jgi:ABC-type transporter Mla maintaining outer membrane lipid asymmetry ATPase subunit MlaF
LRRRREQVLQQPNPFPTVLVDEPYLALDPISTLAAEDLMSELEAHSRSSS